MSQQLKNPLRLRGKRSFDQIFRDGARVTLGSVTAMVLPADRPQLGLAVRRSYGNAVKRNQFKRRVRAAFHQHHAHLSAQRAVISPSAGSKSVTFAEIETFIMKYCRHVG